MIADLISRKDIALILGPHVSAEMVRRKEKRLGLEKARADLGTKAVLYRRAAVIRILIARGAIESE